MKRLCVLAVVSGMHLSTPAMAQVPLQVLRTCLDVEDQSKERLDCYDEKIPACP